MSKVLKVVAAGDGGVDEMQAALNDNNVQFGLLKFSLGSGSLKRTKLVYVQFMGSQVNGVKKAKANTRRGEVKAALQETNGEVLIDDVADCTVEFIFEQNKKVFVSEDGQFSAEDLRKSMQKEIDKGSKPVTMGKDGQRLTAAEIGDIPGDMALKEVRSVMGPFNWALFVPNKNELEFFNAGSMSCNEMIDWLKEDQILYGLLRMGFGRGQFRRTKWISIWWRGDEVPNLERSRMVALQGEMIKKMEPFSLTIFINSIDEISLDVVIEKVKRAAVVDGENSDESAFSMEEFMSALDEEMLANAKFFAGYQGRAKPKNVPEKRVQISFDFEKTLRDIRAPDGQLTWGLFELK